MRYLLLDLRLIAATAQNVMRRLLIAVLLVCSLTGYAHSAILVNNPNGGADTVVATLALASTGPYAGRTISVNSALSAVQSNISSATVHAWPTDRALRVDKGGSIANSTAFTVTGKLSMDGGTFSGAGAVTINGPFSVAGDYHCFTGAGAVTGLKTAKPAWFAATPSGATINTAIGSIVSGGSVELTGAYTTTKNNGTNDRWGININKPMTLYSNTGATIRRAAAITDAADAYPVILVGVADSLPAAIITGVTIKGITFTGNDTRHALSGQIPHDFRSAIEPRNVRDVTIEQCTFNSVDTSAIFTTYPGYDYSTTKVYNLRVINNTFNVVANATAYRALTKAVVLSGTDGALVDKNTFNNCDTAVAGTGTYETPEQVETSTWTSALGAVNRGGRGWIISNNLILNSSEHALYPAAVDVTITNNTLRISAYATQNGNIKIRSRKAVVSGNSVTSLNSGIILDCPSYDVSVTGNTLTAVNEDSAGQIDITSFGLTSFITTSSAGYFASFIPMGNFTITGNTLNRASGSETYGYAFRIYTDITDANFPNGQIRGVTYTGNVVNNPRVGLMLINNLTAGIVFSNNVLHGKAFTKAAFATSTTMNSKSVIGFDPAATSAGTKVKFNGNSIEGFAYIFGLDSGAAGAGTLAPVTTFVDNTLNYIQYIRNAAIAEPAITARFSGNNGTFFLDRALPATAGLNNALGDGTTFNSYYKSQILWSGTNLLYFTDDSATTKQLDN